MSGLPFTRKGHSLTVWFCMNISVSFCFPQGQELCGSSQPEKNPICLAPAGSRKLKNMTLCGAAEPTRLWCGLCGNIIARVSGRQDVFVNLHLGGQDQVAGNESNYIAEVLTSLMWCIQEISQPFVGLRSEIPIRLTEP
jgi:hypothetical protein